MTVQFAIAYRMYTCFDIWGNFLQQVQAGLLAAVNHQNDTVTYYVYTCILQQMGFAYIFAFYFKLEMYGIWIARISSGLTNCLIFYIILRNVDVGTEIIKVHERLEAQKAKNEAELQELEDMAQRVVL